MYKNASARYLTPVVGLVLALLFSAATLAGERHVEVTLSGAAEVPPVETAGSGSGVIVVGKDRAISGSVTTENVAGTMAHIHMAPPDGNGPVAIPLEETAEGTWSVPEGAKLNDEQYQAFKAGNLYINVHSAAHPAGEVRGQLVP